MRGIVLYKSKYGATKKYAEWISEEMQYDMMDVTKVKKKDVQDYDIIVLGGGIYAMGIAGLDFLRKNPEFVQQKKVFVFCDGASPFDEEAFAVIRERNMKEVLRDVPLFYFRGGWDMAKMSFMDRNLCKMLQKAVDKKDPSEYEVWEKALVEAGKDACDWTNQEYIKQLIEKLKAL